MINQEKGVLTNKWWLTQKENDVLIKNQWLTKRKGILTKKWWLTHKESIMGVLIG